MRRYVVTYDISSDASRRQVARLLSRQGKRVQESVFELILPPEQLQRLLRRLERHLNPFDSVLAYPTTGEVQGIGFPCAHLEYQRLAVG